MGKKIGIITCINQKSVNYGNRMQTYALNRYLRNLDRDFVVHTLEFLPGNIYIRTAKRGIIERVKGKIERTLRGRRLNAGLKSRLENCREFSRKNIAMSGPVKIQDIKDLDYDIMITGSDVVWYQNRTYYKPLMFLDFNTAVRFRKIAYAASFGTDFIPDANKPYVTRALQSFASISVREKSSVELVKSLGIGNVTHCVDPVLLITPGEWEALEKPVFPDGSEGDDFIFVYLLGDGAADRRKTEQIAAYYNMKIVTVPYAGGRKIRSDASFGDYRVMDCSPEQWIWLIHHSQYVVTDSFHGVVFSTIFEKRFIAVDRKEYGINNRILDYLDTIGETDKFVDVNSIENLEGMVWDYAKISSIMEDKERKAKDYLSKTILGEGSGYHLSH